MAGSILAFEVFHLLSYAIQESFYLCSLGVLLQLQYRAGLQREPIQTLAVTSRATLLISAVTLSPTLSLITHYPDSILSSQHIVTLYKSEIHPSIEYCSHIWSGASKTSLRLLDKIQVKAIRLIDNINLSYTLQSLFLSHRRNVASTSLF